MQQAKITFLRNEGTETGFLIFVFYNILCHSSKMEVKGMIDLCKNFSIVCFCLGTVRLWKLTNTQLFGTQNCHNRTSRKCQSQ